MADQDIESQAFGSLPIVSTGTFPIDTWSLRCSSPEIAISLLPGEGEDMMRLSCRPASTRGVALPAPL